MRAARVLMNLGRASALAAGPRRRGADREAWNRSRRTLLRAREAAERTGGELGDEALKLEAQMAARERTERDRGIPAGYEPGETPPAERPASYFVRDPEARAQLEAKERAEGGYDPDRQARAHRAYRRQIGTVSRGYGAPPAPKPRTDLRPGAAYSIQETRRPGAPMVQEVPAERLEGAPSVEGAGTARLREGYPAPSMEREQALGAAQRAFVQTGAQGAQAYEQSIAAGATEQEAQDAVAAVQRQQALRAQLQAAGAPILPGPQTLGEIQAQQAIVAAQQAEAAQAEAEAAAGAGIAPRAAEAGVAGMEAEAQLGQAQASTAAAWAGAIQQLGPEGLIATMNQTDPMESAAALNRMAAEARAAGDEVAADWFQRAAIARMGGQVVEVPDPGIIARVTNFINALVGSPYRVDFGGRKQEVIPTAPVGGGAAAGAQAGAVIPGNVDTATASPEELVAIRDAAEAELQRRQRAGAR